MEDVSNLQGSAMVAVPRWRSHVAIIVPILTLALLLFVLREIHEIKKSIDRLDCLEQVDLELRFAAGVSPTSYEQAIDACR